MGRSRQRRADKSHSTGVLCEISFDLSDMERGELCHDRCVCLLLAEYMQDVGASQAERGKGDVQALYLSA